MSWIKALSRLLPFIWDLLQKRLWSLRILKNLGLVRSPSSNYNEKVYSLAILEYEETGRPSIVTALKDEDVKDLFMTLIRTDDIGAFNTKMKRLINQREFGDIINNDNVDFIQEFSEFERILREEINKTTTLSISSIANINTSVGLEHEFQAQIDHAQRLIKNHNPQQALDYLVELKKRIWRRANRNIKYDILSNLASANFELMNFPETAENVVSALQYNPEDDKAIGNCALGYFLILENEKAKELISKAVKKNELSVWSWTNYINIFSKEKTPSDFLRIIPKSIQKKPSIAFALGIAFKQRKQFQKAMEWLEVAYKDKDSIELKAELGLLIIEMKYNDFSKLMGEQISETDKNDINRAIQLLADAWNLVKNRDLAIVKSHWIFEISRAKFLIGDYKGGLRDVSEAIEIKPNNSYYLKLRGLIQYQMGHYENAIRDLKSIADDKSISDRFLVLAGFLRTNKQIDDAIALLEESLRIEEKKSIKSDEKRLLIDLYCEREDFEKAEQLLNSIPENVKDNILWLISSSKVKRLKGEIEKGKEILIYALGQITENTSYGELFLLGTEMYEMKRYKEAASVLERITQKDINTRLTRDLLFSFYYSGDYKSAINICRTIRGKYGILSPYAKLEGSIREYIGNFDEASRIYSDYGIKYPDDLEVKFRLMKMYFILKQYDKVDEFLDSPPDFEKLSIDFGIELVLLMKERNRFVNAIDLMYELRRKFFNHPNAHLKYTGLMMSNFELPDDWTNIESIGVNSAVVIHDDTNKEHVFIIENRDDSDASKNEYSPKHPIIAKMIGKKRNQRTIIRDGHFDKEEGVIVTIVNKYIYALEDSMQRFQERFPDVSGLEMIKSPIVTDKGEFKETLKPMFDFLKEKQLHWKEATEYYKQIKITFGTLVTILHSDEETVYQSLLSDSSVGFRFCSGSREEESAAIQLIKSEPLYVIDLTAVFTIFILAMENYAAEKYRFAIAQSTKNVIEEIYQEAKYHGKRERIILGGDGDRPITTVVSKEDVEFRLKRLDDIRYWLDNSCDVIEVREALNLNADEKEELDFSMGSSFHDTILIAKDSSRILYSDDYALREYAKDNYNVKGIWSQPFLRHLLNSGIIANGQYLDSCVKFTCSNFLHTSITPDILFHAAMISEWKLEPPFECTINILGGKYSDFDPAANVSVGFLAKMWDQTIVSSRLGNFIHLTINALLKDRPERIKLLRRFVLIAEARLTNSPLLLREILSVIRALERGGLVI